MSDKQSVTTAWAPAPTPEQAEDAAESLRSLHMILSVFPADTAQERRNLQEWKQAVTLGIEALTYRAGIERAKKDCGHG